MEFRGDQPHRLQLLCELQEGAFQTCSEVHHPCECRIADVCLALDLNCHALGNVSLSFAGFGWSDTHLLHNC